MTASTAKEPKSNGEPSPDMSLPPRRGKAEPEAEPDPSTLPDPEPDEPQAPPPPCQDPPNLPIYGPPSDRARVKALIEKAAAANPRIKALIGDDEAPEARSAPPPPPVTAPETGCGFKRFNFTNEMQDRLLACLLARPNDFADFGEAFDPRWFLGVDAAEVAFIVRDFVAEHGQYPDLSLLVNLAYQKFERVNIDKANQLVNYVLTLAELNTDLCWEGCRKLVMDFIRERTLLAALRKIHRQMMDGKRHLIDPVAMVQAAVSVDTGSLPYESDAALLAANIPDAEPVIEGLLDVGQVALFGASSKHHKTWVNLMLAVGVTYTGQWLGFKCRPGKVLYVNFELTRKSLQSRADALYQRLGVKSNGSIDFVTVKGVQIDPATFLQTLASRCRRKGYRLVIIDPLYMLESAGPKERDAGATENSNYAMGQVMFRFIGLAARAGCAVWVCHHYSKGNKAGTDMLDRFAGAGVLGRALDTAVTLTKHKATDPAKGIRAYSVEIEVRNHKEIDPFVVRWDYPLLVKDATLNPADLAQPAGRKPEHIASDLLALLPPEGLANKDWLIAAAEADIGRTSYYCLRAKLEKEGQVIRAGEMWQPEITD